MNSPTPPDTNPSPKVVKFDFTGVLKKLSTLASAIITAAGAVLTWYISQPDYVQETFPQEHYTNVRDFDQKGYDRDFMTVPKKMRLYTGCGINNNNGR